MEPLRHFDTVDEGLARKMIAILALAKDGAATPAEAESAMAKAQALAIKHNIDLDTVTDSSKQTADARGEFSEGYLQVGKGFRRPPQHRYVASILCTFFNVEIITGRGNRAASLSFLGRSHDVAFATYAYNYLHKSFERLWRAHRRNHFAPMSHRDSFYQGVHAGLWTKLDSNKVEQEKALLLASSTESGREVEKVSESYQLAVVKESDLRDQFIKHRHPVLTYKKWKAKEVKSYSAWNNGHEKGKELEVSPGLAGETKKASLR